MVFYTIFTPTTNDARQFGIIRCESLPLRDFPICASFLGCSFEKKPQISLSYYHKTFILSTVSICCIPCSVHKKTCVVHLQHKHLFRTVLFSSHFSNFFLSAYHLFPIRTLYPPSMFSFTTSNKLAVSPFILGEPFIINVFTISPHKLEFVTQYATYNMMLQIFCFRHIFQLFHNSQIEIHIFLLHFPKHNFH